MRWGTSGIAVAHRRAERLLARFHTEYPEASRLGVVVELAGSRPRLLFAKGHGPPRGIVRVVLCRKTGLRARAVPAHVTREEAKAVEDLCEALSESILGAPFAAPPIVVSPRAVGRVAR